MGVDRKAVHPALVEAAHLVGNEHREEPMMASSSDVARDERTVRMMLSMLVEPNDPVTGRIVSRLGADETLWLAGDNSAVVGLNSVDAQVRRDHLSVPGANELAARIDQVQ